MGLPIAETGVGRTFILLAPAKANISLNEEETHTSGQLGPKSQKGGFLEWKRRTI